MPNPLLELEHHEFPPFSAIKAEHVLPAIKTIIEQNEAALAQQLDNLQEVNWETLVAPLEAREDRLSQAWAPVSHLNGVMNNAELREAYTQALAELSAYYTRRGQNEQLYQAYLQLSESAGFEQLSQAQQQTARNALRDFRLAGVALPAAQKQRFGDIEARLSELSNQFSNNVLDATHGWFKHVTDITELQGLPQPAIDGAAHAARAKELDGFVLTLDGPVYLTVMTQADNRALRREFYEAFSTRASDQGPTAGKWDNTPLIEEILTLRQEQAALLGFDNYAELSLEPKMAKDTAQVVGFLEELAQKSKPQAQEELAELQQWAEETYGATDLQPWDISYYAEKLKEARYKVSQEKLRPWFPVDTVVAGLFRVAGKLFDINIVEQPGVETWHPDAKFYRIERNGQPLAYCYLDLYAREGKRGGAWMADARVRRATEQGVQLPVAFLTCNFHGPVGDKPALLTHSDVTTLFHEFGHGLHHMLTQIDVADVSGINGVAWDAVELPSQFLENWCWEKPVLAFLSRHYDTGEPLSEDAINKLIEARNFQSALFMVRQIEFALFDFKLHMQYGKPGFPGVQALLDEVRREVAAVIPPAFNRFQHGFSHIFAGGYAAGYYSYKWAEVLSADAYSAFEETDIFDEATGKRFLHEILEKGGSDDAMTLFRNFRGREPSIDALLRHSGMRA
jgi:oligopeptidase A